MATVTIGKWETLAEDSRLEKTVKALEAHNITPFVVENAAAAKQKVLEMLPEGTDVFTATSATLTAIGVLPEINESGRYVSIRKQLMSLNRETQFDEMRKIAAAPSYVVGSVHALTENGELLIASFGGSQLPAYAYGAAKVIWVVGTQKLVKDLDEGFARIEEHSLPLESERLKKILGRESDIGKVLVVRKEPRPGRITVILVQEKLGF